MSDTDPIADRRQRARIEYYDECSRGAAPEGNAIALESAIETATQVKITHDILAAANWENTERVKMIFEAAGFEVVE